MPPDRLGETQRSLGEYKMLERQIVDVDRIHGRAPAERAIRDAARLYRDRIATSRPGSTRPRPNQRKSHSFCRPPCPPPTGPRRARS